MNLPERWKLVPVEPTKEMIVRGTVWAKYAEESYKAMLAAAPTPPAQECKCDMRTKLVGDGCEVCNPELAAELASQEDEPVAYLVNKGGRETLSFYLLKDKHEHTPLYTRPDDDKLTTRVPYREAFQRGAASCDKLRKAAESLVALSDRWGTQMPYGIKVGIEELRVALESKPTPSDTDKQSPE